MKVILSLVLVLLLGSCTTAYQHSAQAPPKYRRQYERRQRINEHNRARWKAAYEPKEVPLEWVTK